MNDLYLEKVSQRSVDGLHLQMPMVFKKIKVGQLSYNAQFSISGLLLYDSGFSFHFCMPKGLNFGLKQLVLH